MDIKRITSNYESIGTLRGKLGQKRIATKDKLPVRVLTYRQNGGLISSQKLRTIAERGRPALLVDEAKTLLAGRLEDLPAGIDPAGQKAGALLLTGREFYGDLEIYFGLAGDRFRRDFLQFCKWVILTPSSAENSTGIELTLSAAKFRGVQKFLKGIVPGYRQVLEAERGNIMIINPFDDRHAFFGGTTFDWLSNISYLLGRMILGRFLTGEEYETIALSDESIEYFADHYQQKIRETFIANLREQPVVSFELLQELGSYQRTMAQTVEHILKLSCEINDMERLTLEDIALYYRQETGHEV